MINSNENRGEYQNPYWKLLEHHVLFTKCRFNGVRGTRGAGTVIVRGIAIG